MALIASLNATGWPALPFFAFEAKDHGKAWYHDMPATWRRINASGNGWTQTRMGWLA
jgi:hypothetical protein